MRILVADQNALLLAAITATFGPHCDLVTATRRDVCIAQVEQHKFDVVIACDKLSDYTGLELLSEVGALSPDTLLIFAANSKRLNQLGNRLEMFGLFEALSYPITPRKLLDVLKRARQSLRTPSKPKVRHVVLESEWDTGVRLGLVERDLQARAEAAGRTEPGDDWPKGTEVSAAEVGNPGVEGDDFVFSGPPVVSPVNEPTAPLRAESRARTFEATPVTAQRMNARGAEATEVIEYEVKPVIPALTHDTGTISCDDEFIFAASESVPVYESIDEAAEVFAIEPAEIPVARGREVQPARIPVAREREVEPARVPMAQEPEATIEEFCSNDPIFDVPEPPRWAADGAANDTAYEGKPAPPSHAKRGASETLSSARGKPSNESPADLAYGALSELGAGARSGAAGHAHGAGGSLPTGASGSHESNASRNPHAGAHADAARGNTSTPPSASDASSPTAKSSGAGKAGGASAKTPSAKTAPQPRPRTQAVPTAAQRAAFERAVARRNAESGGTIETPAGGKKRKGARGSAKTEPTIQTDSMDSLFAGAPASEPPSRSLSDLAKMATTKRPLSASLPGFNKNALPKRAAYAVGSGVAVVLILGVLSFELLRNSKGAEHHMPHAATSTQIFSSQSTTLENGGGNGAPQFGPPIQQAAASPGAPPSNLPQAQTFDPSTAPEDPPPPPALEHPGPMEPPSEVHTGPPLGMIQDRGYEQPPGSD